MSTAEEYFWNTVKQTELKRVVQELLARHAGFETDIIDELIIQMRDCDLRDWLIAGKQCHFKTEDV